MSADRPFLNRLLRNLSDEALAGVEPHLTRVDLRLGHALAEPGDPISHIYFPESGVISLVSPFLDGATPELASIGREGLAGCVAAIGSHEAFSRWIVQVPGVAMRCPATAFEDAFGRSGEFRQAIVCYMEALLSQTLQSVACNALHPVEARCCRWILMMRDRSDSDELPLTQEFLAELLSVHRSSVSITTSTLQQAGYIQTRRGVIRIVDRTGLESAACECYRLVRDRFERLLPGTFDDPE